MLFAKISDCFERLVLEDNEVAGIISRMLVFCEQPIRTVQVNRLISLIGQIVNPLMTVHRNHA